MNKFSDIFFFIIKRCKKIVASLEIEIAREKKKLSYSFC